MIRNKKYKREINQETYLGSTFAVASSITRILFLLRIALARQTS